MCETLRLVVHVLGLLDEEQGHECKRAHRTEVPAEGHDAVALDEGRRDGRGEGTAENRGQVVRETSAGVADVSGEELGQVCAAGTKEAAHQHEADAQEDHDASRARVAGGAEQRRREEAEDQGDGRGEEQDGLAAALVGLQAADHDEPGEEEDRDHLHAEVLGLREAEGLDAVGQRPGAEHVEQGVGDAHGAGAEYDLLPVLGELLERGLHHAVLLDGLLEDRCLAHALTDDKAHDDEDRREEERDAPAPGDHGGLVEVGLKQQVHTVGAEEADGRAQVGEGAVEGALVGRRVLRGDQRGAGPLAGKAEALASTAEAEQHDGQRAEDVKAREQADDEGRDAHGHEGDDQRLLAAQLVAEVTEQQRAERAGQERDGEGDEGEQRGEEGILLGHVGEEDHSEVARRGDRIAVVVVELDGGAHHRGSDDLGN